MLLIVAIFSAIASGARAGGPPRNGLMQFFEPAVPARPAPEITLFDGDGNLVPLSDFKGRVVLLNFWATWCAPCVREMPTLDRLQAKLGGPGFTVIAVSEDRGGAKVARPFLKKLGLDNLGVYVDVGGKVTRALGVTGLPTTLLIDAKGRLRGGLSGPAEWDSPEAVALIRYYIDGPGAAD